METGNDQLLAEQGVKVPSADGAAAVEPDGVASPLSTPDITKAQLVAIVPIVAKVAAAFHIFTLTAAQQGALTEALGGAAAVALADAIVRHGRARSPRL